MTCLIKHDGDCCGCDDHPTDGLGSEAWLEHIDQGPFHLLRCQQPHEIQHLADADHPDFREEWRP